MGLLDRQPILPPADHAGSEHCFCCGALLPPPASLSVGQIGTQRGWGIERRGSRLPASRFRGEAVNSTWIQLVDSSLIAFPSRSNNLGLRLFFRLAIPVPRSVDMTVSAHYETLDPHMFSGLHQDDENFPRERVHEVA